MYYLFLILLLIQVTQINLVSKVLETNEIEIKILSIIKINLDK
mgnify:CR=1 FL=1